MTTGRSLEDELADLGAHLDVPDVAASDVTARLRSVHERAPRRWNNLHRRVWAPVSAAIVGVVALVASPAVGDWFGIRGVEVVQSPPTTSSTTTSTTVPAGAALDLGRPSNIDAATKVLGIAPVLPPALGPPDAVWLDDRVVAPYVSFVYDGGTLISEFDATMTDAAIVTKFTQGAAVESMRIDGRPAMWIEGAHQVVLRGRNGDLIPEQLRQSDSVLLVQVGDLTVRIETDGGRDAAIAIARSLR